MSKFCMSCGAEMPDHAGFCPKCGSKVEIPQCPVCGREVDFGVDFCMYCGAKLIEEPPVTVMAEAPQPQGEPFSTWEEHKRTVEPESIYEPTPATEGMKEESPKTVAADTFPKEQEGGPEEDKRYALTARNPNLLTLRRIKNDVILQKDTVIIGDHQEDGSIPLNGKEIPYADIRCVELKWYMSTFFFICCLLLTIIVAVGLIISSIELQEALICILVPALFWWMCSRYNIIILKKDGSQEYIAGQKKAVMETLRKDLQDRVNLKAVSSYTGDLSEFIVKKTGYYQEQFANAKWGEKVKFNWAAFFFTGMFCYYRKSGKIFWQIYRSYLLLSVAAIAGMSVALTSLFKPETNISVCLWVILTLALLQGIYGIICNIRLGKRFNAEYYKRCILLTESGDVSEKKKGTSMGKAILFALGLGLCLSLVGGAIGAVAAEGLIGSNDWYFNDIFSDDPAPTNSRKYYGDDRDAVGHWEFYSMTDGINTWLADEVGLLAATSMDVFSGDAVVIGAFDTETNLWTEVTATWKYSNGEFSYWLDHTEEKMIGQLDSGMLVFNTEDGETLTFRRKSNIAWGTAQRKTAAESVLQGKTGGTNTTEPVTPTQTSQRSSKNYEDYVNDSADIIDSWTLDTLKYYNELWDEKYGSIIAVSTKYPGGLGPLQEEDIPDVMWNDFELGSTDALIHVLYNNIAGQFHWSIRWGDNFPVDRETAWDTVAAIIEGSSGIEEPLSEIFDQMDQLYRISASAALPTNIRNFVGHYSDEYINGISITIEAKDNGLLINAGSRSGILILDFWVSAEDVQNNIIHIITETGSTSYGYDGAEYTLELVPAGTYGESVDTLYLNGDAYHRTSY